MELDNMLDEYMRDEMIDSDMYKEEAFEAFESDADSMLILGQPIDDQIKIKNIASFAIPKSKQQKQDGEGYMQNLNSGDESEECEYEDSFESPGKSLTEQNLREFSSITFGHSKVDNGGGVVGSHENSFQPTKPEKTVKRRKKKKRVPPAAAVAKAVNDKSVGSSAVPVNTNSNNAPAQYSNGNSAGASGGAQNLQPISRSGDRNRNGSAVSGSRSSARSQLPHRVNTAGRSVSGTASAGGYRPQQSQQSQQGQPQYAQQEQQYQQIYRPQQQYQQQYDAQPSSRQQQGSTPPIYPTHSNGQGSVVSHSPSAARAHAVQGGAFNASMLQRQLDTALKQVAMYRRENEALQQNLDSAGINEAVERYKALLIEKQHQIIQLESENNGLKSVARYQGKYLAEKAKDTGGVDSVQSHDKQIEIMLIHTRKMKEKVKKMEIREEELVAENEHLHTQNSRIQRKNAKLKKQVAAAEQYIKESTYGGPRAGPVSNSILDMLHGHSIDTAGSDGGQIDAMDSAGGGEFKSSFDSLTVSAEPSVMEQQHGHPHHQHHQHQQGTSTTSVESLGAEYSQHPHHGAVPGHSGAPHSSAHHGQQQHPPAALLPVSSTKNAQLRRRVEEQELQIRKQQIMIEALEKSLQAQRGRFQREIDGYRAQAEQAAEEQRRLETELDKRERFGRNQVNTLKQIRTAYDELSSGYRKLLSASELYDRDAAPPQAHPQPQPQPEPIKPAELSPAKPSPPRKLAPKAAVLSEEDAYLTNILVPQRPTSSKNSRGASRATIAAISHSTPSAQAASSLTFLTAEEREADSYGESQQL